MLFINPLLCQDASMRPFLRSCGYLFGALLVALGSYLLIHDVLILIHVVAPYGDGPAGVIAGPIVILFGVVIILRLKTTQPVKYED
jgi:hypothetical protein